MSEEASKINPIYLHLDNLFETLMKEFYDQARWIIDKHIQLQEGTSDEEVPKTEIVHFALTIIDRLEGFKDVIAGGKVWKSIWSDVLCLVKYRYKWHRPYSEIIEILTDQKKPKTVKKTKNSQIEIDNKIEEESFLKMDSMVPSNQIVVDKGMMMMPPDMSSFNMSYQPMTPYYDPNNVMYPPYVQQPQPKSFQSIYLPPPPPPPPMMFGGFHQPPPMTPLYQPPNEEQSYFEQSPIRTSSIIQQPPPLPPVLPSVVPQPLFIKREEACAIILPGLEDLKFKIQQSQIKLQFIDTIQKERIPRHPNEQYSKNDTSRVQWVNAGINKDNIIGSMFSDGLIDQYLSGYNYQTPQQFMQERTKIINFLNRNWKQHKNIKIIPIIHDSFYKYGCMTFQPDKLFHKNLKSKYIQTILQQNFNFKDKDQYLFDFLSSPEELECEESEMIDLLIPMQMVFQDNQKKQWKNTTKMDLDCHEDIIQMVRQELTGKLDRQRKGACILVRCKLCNHIVEVSNSSARCRIDCKTVAENGGDRKQQTCNECISQSVECVSHIHFHVNIVDFNLKNQADLSNQEAMRNLECQICKTKFHESTSLSRIANHQNYKCQQNTEEGIYLNRFYGSVCHTSFQHLLKKTLPEAELALVVFYDQGITLNRDDVSHLNFSQDPNGQNVSLALGSLRIILAITENQVINQGENRFDVLRKLHQMSMNYSNFNQY